MLFRLLPPTASVGVLVGVRGVGVRGVGVLLACLYVWFCLSCIV